MWRSGSSIPPRHLRCSPPSDRTGRNHQLIAIKNDPGKLPVPVPMDLSADQDALGPDLALHALDQLLESPEPFSVNDVTPFLPVSSSVLSSNSPQSVCELPTPLPSPMENGEFFSDWLDQLSDYEGWREERDSNGCDLPKSSATPLLPDRRDDTKVDQVVQERCSTQWPENYEDKEDTVDYNEDKTQSSERLRKRQRLYEKKYRNRKKGELKDLRKEWIDRETELFAVRRERVAEAVVLTDWKALSSLDARTPPRDRAELLRRSRLLIALERALVLDRVTLSALKAYEKVARIREYTDKKLLRSRREWQHSTTKVFGPHAKLTPHQPPPLHFTW